MTSAERYDDLGPGLLGVEVGRNKVRLALLDTGGTRLLDIVERPIAKAGGPRDPIGQQQSARDALEEGLERLGSGVAAPTRTAASIGFANCGVGSGPALRGWLESLSEELGEDIVLAGAPGVSYAPTRCIEFVQAVFEGTGLQLARVELAPVASARVLRPLRSGSLTLGSGIAWSARLLDGQVLEAFEAAGDSFDDVLHITAGGSAEPLSELKGIEVDRELCRNRGIEVGALAPSVGVAVSLLSVDQTNLLEAESVRHGAVVAPSRQRVEQHAARVAVPVERRRDRQRAVPEVTTAATGGNAELLTELGIDDEAWTPGQRDEDTRRLTRRTFDESNRGAGPGSRHDERRPVDLDDDLAGIEAFAHPNDEPTNSFNISDFLLGALGMSAIVLLALLVLG